MSYVLVVDSSSDLPKELCHKEGITVVPMPVSIEGNTYNEGVDIFPEEFYPRFPTFKELPKTSQPNPAVLQETYEKILAQGKEVVAIHLSSGLSSTYSTAQMVRDICSQPDKVHVIDSLGASLGYGLLALKSNKILQEAQSWDEAEKKIIQVRREIRYVFTLDTLEYLVKGGRVSKTAGFIGGLLDVKPILHITSEGRIEPLAKVRSRKASLRKLLDLIKEEIRKPEEQVIGISHSACLDEAKQLADDIKKALPIKDVIISDIGCVVGSHTGPKTIALFYQR
ncbi:MAG: DegV family protein [Desulfitobacterium sp.]|nr:DegV family protein [Desulfitobacterium sp.]